MEKIMIDITPTWSGLLPALIDLTQSENPEARRIAYEELQKMAKAADLFTSTAKNVLKVMDNKAGK